MRRCYIFETQEYYVILYIIYISNLELRIVVFVRKREHNRFRESIERAKKSNKKARESNEKAKESNEKACIKKIVLTLYTRRDATQRSLN